MTDHQERWQAQFSQTLRCVTPKWSHLQWRTGLASTASLFLWALYRAVELSGAAGELFTGGSHFIQQSTSLLLLFQVLKTVAKMPIVTTLSSSLNATVLDTRRAETSESLSCPHRWPLLSISCCMSATGAEATKMNFMGAQASP